MPQFNEYSNNGRTLLVKFTCYRCGNEHIDPLEAHDNDTRESYGYLHYILPPPGWKELLHGPLLCPDCVRAYEIFMNNTKEEGE